MLVKLESSNCTEYHFRKLDYNVYVKDMHNGEAIWLAWHDRQDPITYHKQICDSNEAVDNLNILEAACILH